MNIYKKAFQVIVDEQMIKLECLINPIKTKEYPISMTKQYYSLFNKLKIKVHFSISIPNEKTNKSFYYGI